MSVTSRAIARLRALSSVADHSAALDSWWSSLPVTDGFRAVSEPKRFGGVMEGQGAYASQFAADTALESRIGSGLGRLLSGCDRHGPALEMGAGTGTLTRPLITGTSYRRFFISDTSPDFLRRTRESIGPVPEDKTVDFVVLSGDDLSRWPRHTLSLVVLRYALHHVLDWEGFIRAAARALRPGGTLVCEEPCADGYVLQAAMASVLRHSPALLAEASESVLQDLDFFIGTTLFYARSGDKTGAEAKHVFATYRMVEVCHEAGLRPKLFANEGLDGELAHAGSVASPLRSEFRHNLAVNFGFGAETLEFCDRHLLPACEDLAGMPAPGGGPVVKAVLRAVKRSPPPAAAWLAHRFGRSETTILNGTDSSKAADAPAVLEGSGDADRSPAHESAAGFTLSLDYPPAESSAPRWGHGRPSHERLRQIIAAREPAYFEALARIVVYSEQLKKISTTDAAAGEPHWINGFLPGLDAAALYTFVRDRAPGLYVEIGSGNSTKFVARAKRDGDLATHIVSIDPEPRAEIGALCDEIVRAPLEGADISLFKRLRAGDILFFDGSHRSFTGSDVTVFFLEILPQLASGTLVGVHDIFLPDDYPSNWSDRYYSEQYLLASYLLAGCRWIAPVLPAWYASTVPALQVALHGLWGDPHFDGVERHGGAFWFEIADADASPNDN